MRAIGKLGCQRVLPGRQCQGSFGLPGAEVPVLVIEGHRLTCGHWRPVDQQMVVAAAGNDLAGWRNGHAFDAKPYFEWAADRGTVGGFEKRNRLRGSWCRAADQQGQREADSRCCRAQALVDSVIFQGSLQNFVEF